jgi:hypothetical protein
MRQTPLFSEQLQTGWKTPRSSKGPREHYMNWGGWFAHPKEDPDVFYRLPKWRQEEILATMQAFQDDPTLVAFEVHDPATGKAIPGQNVYRPPTHLHQKHEGPPRSFRYNVPNGIPLRIVRAIGMVKLAIEIEDLTPDERRELGYLL